MLVDGKFLWWDSWEKVYVVFCILGIVVNVIFKVKNFIILVGNGII